MTILEFSNLNYSVVATNDFKVAMLNRHLHTITEKQCNNYLECKSLFNKAVLRILAGEQTTNNKNHAKR